MPMASSVLCALVAVLCMFALGSSAAVTLVASPETLTTSPSTVTVTWAGLTSIPVGYSIGLYLDSDGLEHVAGMN